MVSGGQLVCRVASASDAGARERLLREQRDAERWRAARFTLMLEVVWQSGLLLGALLFIFCGVSWQVLLLLLPLLLALVYAVAVVAQQVLADKQVQEQRGEWFGLVLERQLTRYNINSKQLVVSVSLSRHRSEQDVGWMHSVAAPQGLDSEVCGVLMQHLRLECNQRRVSKVQCCTSPLQEELALMLYHMGWWVYGLQHRKLLGTLASMPVTHHALDIHTTQYYD